MITTVPVSLMVLILALLLVAVALFIRAAIRRERGMSEERLAWRPPFLRGEQLRDWAATTVEELARNRLAANRTGDAVVQLATEVEAGAVRAMLPRARPAELKRVVACPEAGQGMVGLTAPEVLAIAGDIRMNWSLAEQKRIHDLAVKNSEWIALSSLVGTQLPALRCPLQDDEKVCCAHGVRPLRCRPLHEMAIATGMGERSVRPAGARTEAPAGEQHEQTVAQGVEIGFTRALKAAGLDGKIYELNSALVRALESPDTAERWAKGEDIFGPRSGSTT